MVKVDTHADALLAKLASRSATVLVVGLGHVGLPLGLALAESGFPVLGLDVDPDKIAVLQKGGSYIQHIPSMRVATAVRSGKFIASSDFGLLGQADAILICVPTPLSPHREPDQSYVESTTRRILSYLRPGQLVVLESTVYPGATEGLVAGILGQSGLVLGEHYFLAFSPEREDPGNLDFTTGTTPKIVGGVGDASRELAKALYSQVVSRVVCVSSASTAEATKLTENIFRAVNIGLVNELKVIYESMGVDIWEVLDAAATKPFGFMRFDPGPGWGGHCIPLDPYFLAWKAREHGLDAGFIELAGQTNRAMPGYVVERLRAGLNRQRKSVNGSEVLVLGLAYKKDVGDTRESPAFEIIKLLLEDGAVVRYHDSLVGTLPDTRRWPGHPEMHSIALDAARIAAHDAVVIVTDHSHVDYDLVADNARLIVDTRGVYRTAIPNLVKA